MSRPLQRLLDGHNSAAVSAAAAGAPAKSPTSSSSTSRILVCYVTVVVLLTILASRFGCVLRFWDRAVNLVLPCSKNALKKEILVSLPTFTFSQESPMSECVICLEDYAVGDEIRLLPQCGHCFHVACVDKWFAARSSCPSCRLVPVSVTA